MTQNELIVLCSTRGCEQKTVINKRTSNFHKESKQSQYNNNKNFSANEMATLDHVLPTDEELSVPEVNISSASLRAGAFHMGKHCENQNNVSEF